MIPPTSWIIVGIAKNNNKSNSSGSNGNNNIETVNVGIGSAEQSTNPEISFLFQERRRKKE